MTMLEKIKKITKKWLYFNIYIDVYNRNNNFANN